MRERSRVEVEFHVLLLSPLHPTCKLIYGYLVAVNLLATELTVNFVEVEAESTSQERGVCLPELWYLESDGYRDQERHHQREEL